MSYPIEVAGRFALEALAQGEGEVCAVFRRSFYTHHPNDRFVCIGDAALGRGPLNALVRNPGRMPAVGETVQVDCASAASWSPSQFTRPPDPAHLSRLLRIAKPPAEGLGRWIVGVRTELVRHARAALEALDDWLAGGGEPRKPAATLIGLGPGLTPSGDDYLGGMLVALRSYGRGEAADRLWNWLAPRLAASTSALSAAHIAAAAAGQAHEALHDVLQTMCAVEQGPLVTGLARLNAVGHCSGWDALAGALAVARIPVQPISEAASSAA